MIEYTGERVIPDHFELGHRIVVEHLDRYRFASAVIANRFDRNEPLRILDAPCGTGYGAALLAEQSGAKVTGLDNDAETIAYAHKRYGRHMPNVDFVVSDLDRDHISIGAYDMVVCFEGIEHVQEQHVVARKLSEALRPGGGILLVSTPRRGGPGSGSTFHTRELLMGEFYELFAPWFSTIEMRGQDLHVDDCEADDNSRFYVMVATR